MKKLYIIILISFSLSTFSQLYIGGRLGLNMSTSSVMPELVNYSTISQFKPKFGVNSGLVFKYRITNAIALQTEFNYSGKGLKAKVDETVNDTLLTGKWNYSFGYFEVPLMVKFLFGGSRIGPFLEVGGYYGYFLSGNYSEQAEYGENEILDNSYDLDKEYQDENDNQKANRTEYGFKAGLGYNFEIDNSLMFVSLRYTQGLTDIVTYKEKPENYIKTYNRTFQIAVGYLLQVGNNKVKEYWY
jgi:hypothetical protein